MRNPFMHQVVEYLKAYRGVYSDTTLEVVDRRLRRHNKEFLVLKEKGLISTLDPRSLTLEDIKVFYMTLKERNLTKGTISHELGDIHNLCMFANGNTAVKQFLKRFPQAKAKKRNKRLPPLPPGLKEMIMDEAANVRTGDFQTMRAYAIVLTAFSTGARVIELRNAKVSNLDLDAGTLFLEVVKGADLYGEPRECPIIYQFAEDFLKRYIEEHKRYFNELKIRTDVLFPGPLGLMVSGQSVRRFKEEIAAVCKQSFDFRMCRRDYAQTLIDRGVPYDSVALLMGHVDTSMTEQNYGRKTLDDALREVSNAINSMECGKN